MQPVLPFASQPQAEQHLGFSSSTIMDVQKNNKKLSGLVTPTDQREWREIAIQCSLFRERLLPIPEEPKETEEDYSRDDTCENMYEVIPEQQEEDQPPVLDDDDERQYVKMDDFVTPKEEKEEENEGDEREGEERDGRDGQEREDEEDREAYLVLIFIICIIVVRYLFVVLMKTMGVF